MIKFARPAGTVVAEVGVTAGGASVDFGSLPDDDAAGLAVLGAVPLQGPHLQGGCGVFVRCCVGETLHLQGSDIIFPKIITHLTLIILKLYTQDTSAHFMCLRTFHITLP